MTDDDLIPDTPLVQGGQGRDIDGVGLVECVVWIVGFAFVAAP